MGEGATCHPAVWCQAPASTRLWWKHPSWGCEAASFLGACWPCCQGLASQTSFFKFVSASWKGQEAKMFT